jgi:hypothetical protein
MDPFPSAARDRDAQAARDAVQRALGGPLELHRFAARHPRETLASIGSHWGVTELELLAIGGQPVYRAAMAGGDTRMAACAEM